jgi:hypothetical protein
MKHRSALLPMTAIVLVTVVVGCHKGRGGTRTPPGTGTGAGSGGGVGAGSGGGRGGRGDHGGFVSSPIAFAQSGATCISLKEDSVKAVSDADVVWAVVAQPSCGFEGQTVEIVFTSGGNPGYCHCADSIRNHNAKLKLKVKKHEERHSYTYEIRVAGKPIADPRLEVDP